MSLRRYEGRSLQELLARIKREVGPHAKITEARRMLKGGIAGFFAKEVYVLTVDVPDAASAARSGASDHRTSPGRAVSTSDASGAPRAARPHPTSTASPKAAASAADHQRSAAATSVRSRIEGGGPGDERAARSRASARAFGRAPLSEAPSRARQQGQQGGAATLASRMASLAEQLLSEEDAANQPSAPGPLRSANGAPRQDMPPFAGTNQPDATDGAAVRGSEARSPAGGEQGMQVPASAMGAGAFGALLEHAARRYAEDMPGVASVVPGPRADAPGALADAAVAPSAASGNTASSNPRFTPGLGSTSAAGASRRSRLTPPPRARRVPVVAPINEPIATAPPATDSAWPTNDGAGASRVLRAAARRTEPTTSGDSGASSPNEAAAASASPALAPFEQIPEHPDTAGSSGLTAELAGSAGNGFASGTPRATAHTEAAAVQEVACEDAPRAHQGAEVVGAVAPERGDIERFASGQTTPVGVASKDGAKAARRRAVSSASPARRRRPSTGAEAEADELAQVGIQGSAPRRARGGPARPTRATSRTAAPHAASSSGLVRSAPSGTDVLDRLAAHAATRVELGGPQEAPEGNDPTSSAAAVGTAEAHAEPMSLLLDHIGFPTSALPAAVASLDATPERLVAVFGRLPVPPPLPTSPDQMLIVVGELKRALRLARQLALDSGFSPSDVVLASPKVQGSSRRPRRSPSRTQRPPRVIRTAEEAASYAAEPRGQASGPAVVALDAPIAGGARAWARTILEVLDPTLVVGVVEATVKPEDVCAWARALGGIDTIALEDSRATCTPLAVLACGVPVALVDGQPATPERWLGVVAERTRPALEAAGAAR